MWLDPAPGNRREQSCGSRRLARATCSSWLDRTDRESPSATETVMSVKQASQEYITNLVQSVPNRLRVSLAYSDQILAIRTVLSMGVPRALASSALGQLKSPQRTPKKIFEICGIKLVWEENKDDEINKAILEKQHIHKINRLIDLKTKVHRLNKQRFV